MAGIRSRIEAQDRVYRFYGALGFLLLGSGNDQGTSSSSWIQGFLIHHKSLDTPAQR